MLCLLEPQACLFHSWHHRHGRVLWLADWPGDLMKDADLFARCMLQQRCDVKVPSCGSKGALPWHVSSAGLSWARSWPSCCLGVKWLLCTAERLADQQLSISMGGARVLMGPPGRRQSTVVVHGWRWLGSSEVRYACLLLPG
jgi:hypothetical protein